MQTKWLTVILLKLCTPHQDAASVSLPLMHPLHILSQVRWTLNAGASARVLLTMVIAVGLCACTPERPRHVLREALGGAHYGGTYRINMIRGNPGGLDPVLISSKLADDLALQIYDRLITFDSTLSIVPELALRWEYDPKSLVYTFHLRTDVVFQDDPCFPEGRGRAMISRDVAYSLSRCCDPRTRSVAFWVFKDKVPGANEYFELRSDPSFQEPASHNGYHNIVPGFSCPDDSTFCIRLTKAYAPFLMQLANALGCVVPYEAVEYYKKDFFRHPVGTGAFRMRHWADDHEMLLERNPHYWKLDRHGNRLPFFDAIRVSFITDDKVQFQEFVAQNLDESFTIPTEMFGVLFDPETKTLRKNFDFVVQQKPAMLSWFIDFLCSKPPFDNVHLRRALAYSIDREKLVRFVLRNAPFAPALHGITPPVMPGYTIDSIPGFSFNPKRAREELRAAGFEDGSNVPELTLSVYPEPRLLQVAESIQHMIHENLNIRIKIQVLQFAQLLEMAEAGKLSMWGTRWYGDYPDVENYLALWDGSLVPKDSSQPSYPNSTRYVNPDMSTMLERAMAEPNIDQRYRYYYEAERSASIDAPSIMLFYEMHYRLLQPNVRNYPLDAMNRIQLKEAWFDS